MSSPFFVNSDILGCCFYNLEEAFFAAIAAVEDFLEH
jgi:hypothetical protein